MRIRTVSGLLLLWALVGCGGQNVPTTASITGRVTDINGDPVRGATVSTSQGSVETSVNGAYSLDNQAAKDQIVSASYVKNDGTVMRGQNIARARDHELSASINITVAPEATLASITGTVEDKNGLRVEGAKVSVFGGGMWSSNATVTDASGRYTVRGLVAGTGYTVNASAPGYSADFANVTLANGEQKLINMTLLDQGNQYVPQPQNLTAAAWTSAPATRGMDSAREQKAINYVKTLIDPKYQKNKISTRGILGTSYAVEVELEWDALQDANFLGYGIYRGTGSSTPTGLDYYRDPLTGSYIDNDSTLAPGTQFNYQITALGSGYPNTAGSEGPRSAIASATPLPAITGTSVTNHPLTFSWTGGAGSTLTYVYLFDGYPDPGAASVLNPTLNTTGTSVSYSGSALTIGHTYYYVVLGTAGGTAARTISGVGSFVYQN